MVANAMTATDLRRIADAMGPDEVVLADIWCREAACQHQMPNMTPDQWRAFIAWFSEECGGLSADLHEYMEAFAKKPTHAG